MPAKIIKETLLKKGVIIQKPIQIIRAGEIVRIDNCRGGLSYSIKGTGTGLIVIHPDSTKTYHHYDGFPYDDYSNSERGFGAGSMFALTQDTFVKAVTPEEIQAHPDNVISVPVHNILALINRNSKTIPRGD